MDSKPPRVAVYARVSSEEQRAAETIENQIDFARRYCELNSLHVAGLYKDDGVTGTTPIDKRPQGARMLADARLGLFDLILVYRIDRLARKTLHLLNLHEELEQLGIGLRSMTETFDTSTPSGKFFMTLLGSMAALERDTILERTSLGKARKVRQGKRVGSRPLLGYRTNAEGYMEIEPEEAEVIRTIYNLYVEEGLNTIQIADYLTAKGVPVSATFKGTHKGHSGKWRHSRVSEILRNPAYRGEFHCHVSTGGVKEEVITNTPPIVNDEVWHEAAIIRDKNRKNARPNSHRLYLLRSLVRCGNCGLPYSGCSVQAKSFVYYRCTGNQNHNKTLTDRCKAPMVRAERLEDLVWRDIKTFVEDPGPVIAELEAAVQKKLETQLPSVQDELLVLDSDLAAKATERQRVLSFYRRGLIRDDEAEQELRQLDQEVRALQDRRRSLVDRDAQRQGLRGQVVSARLLLEQLRDKVEDPTWETKRALVEALVESIVVHTVVDERGRRTPKVTIRYRFGQPDEPGNDLHGSLAAWTARRS